MIRRLAASVLVAMTGFGVATAAQPDEPWRVDVGASRSSPSGTPSKWSDANIAVTYRPDMETWWTARLEHSDRFGLTDDVAAIRAAHVSITDVSGHVELAAAHNADFRPRIRLEAGVLTPRILGLANWSLMAGLDASVASYRAGEVTSLQPHLILGLATGPTVTFRLIETWDEYSRHRRGYAIRTVSPLSDRLSLILSYSDAPESDLGVTVKTEAVAASVVLEVSDRLALRAGLVREARPAFDRTELGFGITKRF